MIWTETYDAVFFLSLCTLLCSGFGLAIKYCLKSKCEHLSLCFGAIIVDRRVDLETQEEIRALELRSSEDKQDIETSTIDKKNIS